jgi:hypothetical protein
MEDLLQESRASNQFKADVARFLSGASTERVKL